MKQDFHEDFSRPDKVKGSSNRAFGMVFALVFVVVGLWPLLKDASPRIWALLIAAGFLFFALALPQYLTLLNKVWMRVGLLLHRIVSPIVLGLVFVLAVTPVALLLRTFGKDPLNRSYDRNAESYWIVRKDIGPPPETMRNQF